MMHSAQIFYYVQAFVSVIVLVGFLVGTTILQQRSTNRNITIIDRTTDEIKSTFYWKQASIYYSRRKDIDLFKSPAHVISTWFLILIVAGCASISYFGANVFNNVNIPSYVLGGPKASVALSRFSNDGGAGKIVLASNSDTISPTNPSVSSGKFQDLSLSQYQSSTVLVWTMAFIGSYVYIIASLLKRIDNDEMSPISYHFLSARVLTACLVASVARHIVGIIPGFETINSSQDGAPLAALGFLIGWNPTLWINEIVLKLSNLFQSQVPFQRHPDKKNMPENASLSMVQGLNDDEIERLAQLNINNCQELGNSNPVLIWARTSYNFEIILDWLFQAQLCVIFESDVVEKLRRCGITDLIDYLYCASDDNAMLEVAKVIGVDRSLVSCHKQSIEINPAYKHALELRQALSV